MYNTSSDWKEKIYEDVQSVMNVYFDNVLIDSDNLLDFKKGGEILEEEFKLGATPSQYIELKVYKNQLTIPEKIRIEYGILINGDYEIIPLGIYNVDDFTDNDDETITIKALDNMIKFEFNYDGSDLIQQQGYATLMQVLQDICTKGGVELRFCFFFKYE